jgi:hypothetical protein
MTYAMNFAGSQDFADRLREVQADGTYDVRYNFAAS